MDGDEQVQLGEQAEANRTEDYVAEADADAEAEGEGESTHEVVRATEEDEPSSTHYYEKQPEQAYEEQQPEQQPEEQPEAEIEADAAVPTHEEPAPDTEEVDSFAAPKPQSCYIEPPAQCEDDTAVAEHTEEEVRQEEEEEQQPVHEEPAAPAPEPAHAPEPAVDVHVSAHASAAVEAPKLHAAAPSRNGDADAEQPTPTVKPSAMAKEKSPSPASAAGGDVCRVCGKKVYPLEKLVAEKNIFHKTCFRCKKCNRTLSNSNYATLENDYYCKPHQLELFRLQGRYQVSETHAEVVNRSTGDAPAADAQHAESSAEDLRRARAIFEQKAAGEQHPPSPTQHQPPVAQYGGVGALKSRYMANATQGADAGRPPPRKITPPPGSASAGTNGSEPVEHGEFENDPVRIDGVVRETDRNQHEAELPKSGSARSALAVFRNLESASKGGASVSVSADVKADSDAQ